MKSTVIDATASEALHDINTITMNLVPEVISKEIPRAFAKIIAKGGLEAFIQRIGMYLLAHTHLFTICSLITFVWVIFQLRTSRNRSLSYLVGWTWFSVVIAALLLRIDVGRKLMEAIGGINPKDGDMGVTSPLLFHSLFDISVNTVLLVAAMYFLGVYNSMATADTLNATRGATVGFGIIGAMEFCMALRLSSPLVSYSYATSFYSIYLAFVVMLYLMTILNLVVAYANAFITWVTRVLIGIAHRQLDAPPAPQVLVELPPHMIAAVEEIQANQAAQGRANANFAVLETLGRFLI